MRLERDLAYQEGEAISEQERREPLPITCEYARSRGGLIADLLVPFLSGNRRRIGTPHLLGSGTNGEP